MKENLKELEKFIEMSGNLGVGCMIWNLKENNNFQTTAAIQNIETWSVQRDDWEFNYQEQLPHLNNNFSNIINNAVNKAKDLKVPLFGLSSWANELQKIEKKDYTGLESQPKDCVFKNERVFITSNGDVRMCCYQIGNKPLGNLNEEEMDTIWNNKEFKETRRKLERNEIPSYCKRATCMYIKGF